MSKEKHIPTRMCVVTREKKPKNELIRFVLEDGKVALDTTGKARGRGANMTPKLEIFDQGVKSNALKRALKTDISKEDLERLRSELENYFKRKDGPVVVRIKKEELDNLKKDENGKEK